MWMLGIVYIDRLFLLPFSLTLDSPRFLVFPSPQITYLYTLFPKMPKEKEFDVERCATASIKQSNGCHPSLSSKNGRPCVIAIQHLDGRAVLIDATIKEEVGGDLVFSSVKKQISKALGKFWHQRLAGKLFMGLVVGTARVNQVHQNTLRRTI